MKKNIYSCIVLITIIILTTNIFVKSKYLTDIIIFSINLFINNIFPSLFPMFIISHILVELNIPDFLGSIFNKIFNSLFKCSGYSSFVFFMSIITGFPSNAKYINDLIEENKITSEEGEAILKFTFFSNPLFIINTVGTIFLNDKKLGIYIFIALFIGNIITGILYRKHRKENNINKNISNFTFNNLIEKINSSNIIKITLQGIKQSLEILTNIFGIVTFCLIIVNLLFNNPNNYFKVLISGIIEMTTGLKYLSNLNTSLNIKIMTATFFLAFGGLSIHAQIMNILKEKKVRYLPFLKARLIHSFISIVVIFIISYMDKLF